MTKRKGALGRYKRRTKRAAIGSTPLPQNDTHNNDNDANVTTNSGDHGGEEYTPTPHKSRRLFTPSTTRHSSQATMPARSPLLDRTNQSDSSVSSDSEKGINIV